MKIELENLVKKHQQLLQNTLNSVMSVKPTDNENLKKVGFLRDAMGLVMNQHSEFEAELNDSQFASIGKDEKREASEAFAEFADAKARQVWISL